MLQIPFFLNIRILIEQLYDSAHVTKKIAVKSTTFRNDQHFKKSRQSETCGGEETMTDCIFCKIVNGEIPAHKIYESEHVLAFLDIEPLSRGHCLIIPKQHAEKLHHVTDDSALQEILIVAKKIAQALKIENYNILQNNGRPAHQFVPHVHFHLIPKINDEGLGLIWKANKVSQDELAQVATEIKENLS